MTTMQQMCSDAPARLSHRFWTTAEERVLRDTYPVGGPQASAQALPRRSLAAIYGHARLLRLRAPRTPPNGRRYWHSDPDIDAHIRAVYTATPDRCAIRALAARLQRPRWSVTKRATELALIVPRIKEPAWTPAEIDILRETTALCLSAVWRRLRAAGFVRTETAIAVQRKRLGLRIGDARLAAGFHTARQVGALLGVDSTTVCNWIAREGLPATRRGTRRTAAQGGDQWQIRARDLRRWIGEHAQLIDLRKADRYWIIDLLLGRY